MRTIALCAVLVACGAITDPEDAVAKTIAYEAGSCVMVYRSDPNVAFEIGGVPAPDMACLAFVAQSPGIVSTRNADVAVEGAGGRASCSCEPQTERCFAIDIEPGCTRFYRYDSRLPLRMGFGQNPGDSGNACVAISTQQRARVFSCNASVVKVEAERCECDE